MLRFCSPAKCEVQNSKASAQSHSVSHRGRGGIRWEEIPIERGNQETYYQDEREVKLKHKKRIRHTTTWESWNQHPQWSPLWASCSEIASRNRNCKRRDRCRFVTRIVLSGGAGEGSPPRCLFCNMQIVQFSVKQVNVNKVGTTRRKLAPSNPAKSQANKLPTFSLRPRPGHCQQVWHDWHMDEIRRKFAGVLSRLSPLKHQMDLL